MSKCSIRSMFVFHHTFAHKLIRIHFGVIFNHKFFYENCFGLDITFSVTIHCAWVNERDSQFPIWKKSIKCTNAKWLRWPHRPHPHHRMKMVQSMRLVVVQHQRKMERPLHHHHHRQQRQLIGQLNGRRIRLAFIQCWNSSVDCTKCGIQENKSIDQWSHARAVLHWMESDARLQKNESKF